MKTCKNIENKIVAHPDTAAFCCEKYTVPIVSRKGLSLDHFFKIRNTFLKGLNLESLQEQEAIEIKTQMAELGFKEEHPCTGCPKIEETEYISYEIKDWKLGDLELTAPNGCNAKCDYCPMFVDEHYFDFDPEQASHFEGGENCSFKDNLNLYEACLEHGLMVPHQTKILFSGGEPSTHGQTLKIMKKSVEERYPNTILTNAIRYSKEIYESLKTTQSWIVVSLDSADRESYNFIKGVDKFDVVMENLKKYSEAARSNDQAHFDLKYIMYDKNNDHELIDKFVEIAKELDVDSICFALNFYEGERGVGKNNGVSEETLSSMLYFFTKMFEAELTCRLDAIPHHMIERVEKDIGKTYVDYVRQNPALNRQRALDRAKVMHYWGKTGMIRYFLDEVIKDLKTAEKQKIALYGAGDFASLVADSLSSHNIQPIVAFDRSPKPLKNPNIKVAHFEDVAQFDEIETVLIASSVYHEEIENILRDHPKYADLEIINPYTYQF